MLDREDMAQFYEACAVCIAHPSLVSIEHRGVRHGVSVAQNAPWVLASLKYFIGLL